MPHPWACLILTGRLTMRPVMRSVAVLHVVTPRARCFAQVTFDEVTQMPVRTLV